MSSRILVRRRHARRIAREALCAGCFRHRREAARRHHQHGRLGISAAAKDQLRTAGSEGMDEARAESEMARRVHFLQARRRRRRSEIGCEVSQSREIGAVTNPQTHKREPSLSSIPIHALSAHLRFAYLILIPAVARMLSWRVLLKNVGT